MSVGNLRGKTKEELLADLSRLQKELTELRLKLRAEGLEDTRAIGKKRRAIARVMTVIREKEILSEVL